MKGSDTAGRPAAGRSVKLVANVAGLPDAESFVLTEEPVPTPAADEVLVRNLAFRVSAAIRMLISEGAQEAAGVPFPVLGPGDTLVGEALGEVVEAPAGSALRAGDLVKHYLGWREYAAVPGAACMPVPPGSEPAVVLGEGWTAYAALTRGADLRPGETVFVSAGSSAIGACVGQLARLLGAARVVTSTGSAEKAAQLVDELGFDDVVLRNSPEPIAEQLRRVAPDGIDVVIDLVGGEQLEAALDVARDHARIVVVGALSGQLAATGNGHASPVTIDSAQIAFKRLAVSGYSADDDAEGEQEWFELQDRWIRGGKLRVPHTVVPSLEQAVDGLLDALAGKHVGTVIVDLDAARAGEQLDRPLESSTT